MSIAESPLKKPCPHFPVQEVVDFSKCLTPDFLYSVFTHIEITHLGETLYMVSLTCRKWKILVDDGCLWDVITANLNIPLPNNLRNYYFRMTTNKLATHASHLVFEEIPVKLDFERFDEIYFVRDDYVLGHQNSTLYIQSLQNAEELITRNFKTSIYSICVYQDIIYCSLDNGEVLGFPIHMATSGSLRPYIDSFETTSHGFTQVFATDLWLITISDDAIKQWSRETLHPIISYPLQARLFNFQTCHPGLYFSVKDSGKETVISQNLNEKRELSLIREFDSEITHLQFNDRKGGYCYSQPKTLSFFNLDARDELVNYTVAAGDRFPFPPFQIIHDLAIVAHPHDPDISDRNNPFIEWINLRSGASSKTHHPYSLHASKKGSFTLFYDTLIFATNDRKIVKVTLPDSV